MTPSASLVLTGAGDRAFCSGIDLGSISNANPDLTPLERKSQLHDEIHQVALALEALDKPVIAVDQRGGRRGRASTWR